MTSALSARAVDLCFAHYEQPLSFEYGVERRRYGIKCTHTHVLSFPVAIYHLEINSQMVSVNDVDDLCFYA
jgi:hypothetical protein